MGNQSPYAKLYDTARWKRMAKHQLRTEPLCRYCAAQGRTTPATAPTT